MIQNFLYRLLETIFPKKYKMCLIRDLYNITTSDGEDSQLRNDKFAVTCAEENITQSMLIEFARNPFAIRDCYPHSKRNMEKFIYSLTTMLLIEGDCTEKAIAAYKHSMYKLGLDDVDIVKVIVALGQSNPKFQSATISYMAYVDIDTVTALGKIHKTPQNKISEQYAELIHGIIPSNAKIIYVKEDNLCCNISFRMKYTDYSLMLMTVYQTKISVSLFSSFDLKGEWEFSKCKSQASMANKINDDIDRMIYKGS